MEYLLEIIALA